MRKSYMDTKRGRERRLRRLGQWLDAITIPHPPVKGVSARKSYKNTPINVRIQRDAARRVVARRHFEVVDWVEGYARITANVSVTIL